MGEFSREYLSLLSEKYKNEAAVCSEIINLEAILTLPKGTEHFISDLHGEYDAVRHILNNCSCWPSRRRSGASSPAGRSMLPEGSSTSGPPPGSRQRAWRGFPPTCTA